MVLIPFPVVYFSTLSLYFHSKKRFQGLYRQYCDQVDAFSRQIIQSQSHLLSTVLLHDAESHDLESNKEFYEVSLCCVYAL